MLQPPLGIAAWGTSEEREELFWDVVHMVRCYVLQGEEKHWPGNASKRYLSSLSRVKTLAETARVLRQLLGELGVSHAKIVEPVPAGILLADDRALDALTFFDGSRRWITKGPADSTDPLPPRPITQINGSTVPAGVDPYSLSIQNIERAHVTVQIPGANELQMALSDAGTFSRWYADEIRNCAALVSEATCGSGSYVHVPDVAATGVAAVERLCRGWDDSRTLIVDLRFNEGGPYADYLAGLLQNLLWRRSVMLKGNTQSALLGGPDLGIVLVNERTGSGGENLTAALSCSPHFTVVGARTFGAGTGFTRTHKLSAGLLMTLPEFELKSSRTGSRIENSGVEPDITISSSPLSQRPLANADLVSAASLATSQITATEYREVG
jgi:tricorn protease